MRIVIVGGGPGGYEAALVAAELGAEVTIVDRMGLGGACVLWDCVPSKTLCTSAEAVTWLEQAPLLGVGGDPTPRVDLAKVFARIVWLAEAQSRDVEKRVAQAGVRVLHGSGRFLDPHTIEARTGEGDVERLSADVALVATGSSPRELDSARPDGHRILDSRQVYDLPAVPEHLVVVGSGATGAEFAHAFRRLGAEVTLVSSRERMLPSEDQDAARVVEEVFERRGMTLLRRVRALGAHVESERVLVELNDGRTIEGSHALFSVGQVPNSGGLGLADAGVATDERGAITVDGVSRTNAGHVYAAGDVTGHEMLASTAAMQGRIAMWHALGQAVSPMQWDTIASTVFTDPEIATVGILEQTARERDLPVDVSALPLATNARAKMVGLEDGFVKIVAQRGGGAILGATVVAPHASDLILPLSVAVTNALSVAQVARSFAIYPSLGGSITEAARRLMRKR